MNCPFPVTILLLSLLVTWAKTEAMENHTAVSHQERTFVVSTSESYSHTTVTVAEKSTNANHSVSLATDTTATSHSVTMTTLANNNTASSHSVTFTSLDNGTDVTSHSGTTVTQRYTTTENPITMTRHDVTSAGNVTLVSTAEVFTGASTVTASPHCGKSGSQFDVASFLGGIVLALVLTVIVVFSYKWYKNRKSNTLPYTIVDE